LWSGKEQLFLEKPKRSIPLKRAKQLERVFLAKEARDALAYMSEEDLTEMILRLGRYTLRESNRLRWRTGDSVELPGGETVDSIVSLALEKTLSGERQWNSEAQPNIQEYLMDVIDSLLYHLATTKENTLFVSPSLPNDAMGAERYLDSKPSGKAVDWLIRTELSPEAALLRKEEEALHERAFELLLIESQNDPMLLQVIEAVVNGNDKPDKIATATGLNIREVYNAMKRLDRKAVLVSSQLLTQSPDLARGR
jgi:hypothetical protein